MLAPPDLASITPASIRESPDIIKSLPGRLQHPGMAGPWLLPRGLDPPADLESESCLAKSLQRQEQELIQTPKINRRREKTPEFGVYFDVPVGHFQKHSFGWKQVDIISFALSECPKTPNTDTALHCCIIKWLKMLSPLCFFSLISLGVTGMYI